MTDGIDIWRAAKVLVDRHGDEAPVHAAMRANELLEEGDIEGQHIWKRILSAIDNLLRRRGENHLH